MMIVLPTRLAETKIVLILASFQGTHAPIQPPALSTITNPFALVHLAMKKMLLANVLQVKELDNLIPINEYNQNRKKNLKQLF